MSKHAAPTEWEMARVHADPTKQVPLHVKVKMAEKSTAEWPTPTSCDGTGGPGKATTAQGSENLRTAVQLKNWPTPTRSDFATRRPSENWMGNDLPSQVGISEKKPLALLNPGWVENLMGFPDGWTDGLPRPEKTSMNGSNREQSQSAPIDPID
jgi:hypothetical protein